MNLISLAEKREEREQQKATAQTLATFLVDTAATAGCGFADEAFCITRSLSDPDRQLALNIERFCLRRSLRRMRGAWREGLGRESAEHCLKLAIPIVRRAYWVRLDEIDPLTTTVQGVSIPLVRAGAWQ